MPLTAPFMPCPLNTNIQWEVISMCVIRRGKPVTSPGPIASCTTRSKTVHVVVSDQLLVLLLAAEVAVFVRMSASRLVRKLTSCVSSS